MQLFFWISVFHLTLILTVVIIWPPETSLSPVYRATLQMGDFKWEEEEEEEEEWIDSPHVVDPSVHRPKDPRSRHKYNILFRLFFWWEPYQHCELLWLVYSPPHALELWRRGEPVVFTHVSHEHYMIGKVPEHKIPGFPYLYSFNVLILLWGRLRMSSLVPRPCAFVACSMKFAQKALACSSRGVCCSWRHDHYQWCHRMR